MSTVMYDAIYVSALPLGQPAYAGYVGGFWPTFPTLQAKFPNARLLSIAVTAGEDAECLDVEKGDATIDQAPAWFRRQVPRGVQRPVVYTSVSNVDALVALMAANGIPRAAYRIWSAHYATEHVCGPASCKDTTATCDGTQWTSRALGRSLDQSLMSDSFFTVPTPAPAPTVDEDDMRGTVDTVADHVISVEAGKFHWIAFFADPTMTGHTAQNLRVAVHSRSKGYSQISTPVSVTSTKPVVTFSASDVDGISISRLDNPSNWVEVGYNLG